MSKSLKPEKDRRKYVRLKIATKVNYFVKGEAQAAPKKDSTVSKNLSAEGVCFISDKELAPGSELELEVFLPQESEPLLLKGQVRWCKPVAAKEKGKSGFEVGVRLFTFSDSDENRYTRYVNDKMMERLKRYFYF